jgi:hypothetical protein
MRQDVEKLKAQVESIQDILDISFKGMLETQEALLKEGGKLAKISKQLEFLQDAIQRVQNGIVVLEHMLNDGRCDQ